MGAASTVLLFPMPIEESRSSLAHYSNQILASKLKMLRADSISPDMLLAPSGWQIQRSFSYLFFGFPVDFPDVFFFVFLVLSKCPVERLFPLLLPFPFVRFKLFLIILNLLE